MESSAVFFENSHSTLREAVALFSDCFAAPYSLEVFKALNILQEGNSIIGANLSEC